MTTIREECVAWCQGRYLTTPWVLNDPHNKVCHVVLGRVPNNPWGPETEDTFGELMMHLVIEDYRMKNFQDGENILYQSLCLFRLSFSFPNE